MPNIFSLYVGTLINLLVISVPIIFVDMQLGEYLCKPITWVYYLLMAIFCFAEAQASFQIPDCKQSGTEKAFVPYLTGICVLVVFWTSIYDYVTCFEFNLLQVFAGCLLIALGVVIRVMSIKKLSKHFVSHISYIENHKLVTTGIYSIVRHPSELGLLSICFGVVMLHASMAGLSLIAFFLLPLVLYRVFLEEKLLLSLFDTDYEEYKAITPCLLPSFIK